MWALTITNPRSEPLQIKLVPGLMVLGRLNTCDIVIDDVGASRRHAEIYYDPLPGLVTIKDLNSSNGTYVNSHRITALLRLQDGDVIRIGQTVMHLARIAETPAARENTDGTQMFSRDLVLEAIDEHPVLLNEIMEKLNTVIDLDTAFRQLNEIVTRTMGVDLCQIILAVDFERFSRQQADGVIARTIHSVSVESTSLEICVPVVGDGRPLAVIHLVRSRPGARPFDKHDLHLAVAISHQAALTIQRIRLIQAAREEMRLKQNLLRFVSSVEADGLLKDYFETGVMPGLVEHKVTVLSVEIAAPGGSLPRSDPRTFTAFLDPFFKHATQIVQAADGIVRYLGDGLLAVFIEAQGLPGPEERALAVAQELLRYIKQDASCAGDQVAVVAVAVNTAMAMVGYIGTRDWVEFNVIGDLVRSTCLMQAQAFPNRILVDVSTADVVRNRFIVQDAGSLSLYPGRPPVAVCEVSLARTAPFAQPAEEEQEKVEEKPKEESAGRAEEKDGSMSAAFRAVAEKFRSRTKKEDSDHS